MAFTRRPAYRAAMADPQGPPLQDWLDALDRAEADVAAGRVVPGDAVMQRLRQTLIDMERQVGGDLPRAAVRRR